jgi:hypothetical protein
VRVAKAAIEHLTERAVLARGVEVAGEDDGVLGVARELTEVTQLLPKSGQ